jgi:hypothetical protein
MEKAMSEVLQIAHWKKSSLLSAYRRRRLLFHQMTASPLDLPVEALVLSLKNDQFMQKYPRCNKNQ